MKRKIKGGGTTKQIKQLMNQAEISAVSKVQSNYIEPEVLFKSLSKC